MAAHLLTRRLSRAASVDVDGGGVLDTSFLDMFKFAYSPKLSTISENTTQGGHQARINVMVTIWESAHSTVSSKVLSRKIKLSRLRYFGHEC